MSDAGERGGRGLCHASSVLHVSYVSCCQVSQEWHIHCRSCCGSRGLLLSCNSPSFLSNKCNKYLWGHVWWLHPPCIATSLLREGPGGSNPPCFPLLRLLAFEQSVLCCWVIFFFGFNLFSANSKSSLITCRPTTCCLSARPLLQPCLQP